MRHEYARVGLAEGDLEATWLRQFNRWLRDVVAAAIAEPNAMILATADPDGRPSARTVLCKGVDERGFVFFTNLTSRKATEAAANPYVSLVFAWHPVGRQVVVRGRVEQIERADTEAYFASRPRDSQFGAWASPQSQVVAGREVLDDAMAAVRRRFGDDIPPAPPHWGGLRVVPDTVEFWQGRAGRLHDRLQFRRDQQSQGNEVWVVERLGP